jgi:hypothetical protein
MRRPHRLGQVGHDVVHDEPLQHLPVLARRHQDDRHLVLPVPVDLHGRRHAVQARQVHLGDHQLRPQPAARLHHLAAGVGHDPWTVWRLAWTFPRWAARKLSA